MEATCKQEVDQLHVFFQAWFNGDLENTDAAYARFSDVMGAGFEMVHPGGSVIKREALLTGLRSAYGQYAEIEFRIWIKNTRVRVLGNGLYLVQYEEWQAKDGEEKGRQTSALFRKANGKPNGLEWLFVHETWMP